MAYAIETRTVATQPTLFVRGATTIPNIAQSIGEFLSAVGRHLAEHAIQPAGMPYTRYHAIDGLNIDLEAGMPIGEAAPGSGRVKSGELPGGPVAATVHVGRYEDLPKAGAALTAWAADNGKRPAGPNWETYLNDPTEVAGPHEYRTEVVMPLAQ
jgi:effector-binding domain-containing protein